MNQLSSKEESIMTHFLEHITPQVGRRSFLLGTVAAGLTSTLGRPGISKAQLATQPLRQPGPAPLPAPKPIPGGIDVPPLIHIFVPGPETITLPFTGFTLQGLHVEPSTITDFQGVTAQAYHVGTATGSDGLTYNLETDVRVYEGEYVAEDGSRREGTFAHM
jgi:hypothetical protein